MGSRKDSRRISNGWQKEEQKDNSMINPFYIFYLSVCYPFAIIGRKDSERVDASTGFSETVI